MKFWVNFRSNLLKKNFAIHKNKTHKKKGTSGTSYVNKPYSITKLSEVLIKEPDYLYFHYVDDKGTKEIEIGKQFNVSIRFSCSTQPVCNCSIINLKFSPNQDKPHHKGTFLITIRL